MREVQELRDEFGSGRGEDAGALDFLAAVLVIFVQAPETKVVGKSLA